MESHGASCGGAGRPGIFGQLHKISNRTVSGDRVSWLQNSLHQNGVEATQGEAGKGYRKRPRICWIKEQ